MDDIVVSAGGKPMPTFFVKSERHLAGTTEQEKKDYFTVNLITSGSQRQFIGDRLLPSDQGCIFFIAPGVPHRTQILEPSTTLTIGFQLEFLHPQFPRSAVHTWASPASLEAAPEMMLFAAQAHIEFESDGDLQQRIFDQAMQLSACSTAQGVGVSAIARARLSLFLLEILKAYETSVVDSLAQGASASGKNERIDELLDFLRSRVHQRVTTEEAAHFMNLSPSCLAARVRRVTGKTLGELQNEIRLGRSKELLVLTDTRISEIAHSCGFDDIGYFSRRFKQAIGQTPGEYRRQHQAGSAVIRH
ncbi:MAG: hypothetical protein RI884_2839 [Pseudomonadota bacterium]|jgi:AraC-like DNA-binding protein